LTSTRGTFDGNNKVITGLYINRSGTDYQGLFGYTPNGTIENLGVANANITGKGYTGGIVGSISNGTVQNCYVTGSVNGNGDRVGGVAGYLYQSTVQNCYSTCNISGTGYVGGVVGHAYYGSTIQNCYSTGNVSGTGSYVGGVVGQVSGLTSESTLQYCYSTGNINGANKTGGVAGSIERCILKNCAALNNSISANVFVERVVGGYSESALANNYAFSRIIGTWSNGHSKIFNGEDVYLQDLYDPNFWTTSENWADDSHWDNDVWNFEINKLPVLKGIGGQSGEGGLYLLQRDIQYATITMNKDTFTYNGSFQFPSLTIRFDGEYLMDITFQITSIDGSGTSAGTNVGTVTLTFTGVRNFTGTKNVYYTIEKRPITIDGITTPDKTYDGEAYVPNGTVTANHGYDVNLLEWLYESTDGAGYSSSTPPADAGAYKLTISVPSSDLNNYGSAEFNFNIEEYPITLAADNVTVEKGTELSDVTLTYTIGNMPDGKTISDVLSAEPVLDCPTFDGNTPGTYPITITGGTAINNYIITSRNNGTLTVAELTYTVIFDPNGGTRTGGGELT
jgi:hypothetical protein